MLYVKTGAAICQRFVLVFFLTNTTPDKTTFNPIHHHKKIDYESKYWNFRKKFKKQC